MNTLKMKIHGFEEDSMSLLVSFASDETESQDPNDYPAYAYQPASMFPEATDHDEIMKMIARSGVAIVENQKRHEDALKNDTNISVYRNLVGTEITYGMIDLLVQPEVDTSVYNDITLEEYYALPNSQAHDVVQALEVL